MASTDSWSKPDLLRALLADNEMTAWIQDDIDDAIEADLAHLDEATQVPVAFLLGQYVCAWVCFSGSHRPECITQI